MRTLLPLAAGAAALALVTAGCGSGSSSGGSTAKPNAPEVNPAGDIPDNQAYVAYTPPGGGFTVKVPEGWSRSDTGSTTTFTDKLNAIRVQSVPAHAPLTVSEAR
ncbi:MAG TPA: hypothetical protein VN751_02255, partial [Solirubrobacteraceae bacterium]|nr:hypothetical protein [Solirubrobacteraceae bacterium]